METRSTNHQVSLVRPCLVEGTDCETAALEDRALSAVSKIRTQFAGMKAELEEARYEVSRLRSEIRIERSKQRQVNDVHVASLRRQVAYRLHPDRGGDAEIMTRLNAMFDLVESLQNDPCEDLAA